MDIRAVCLCLLIAVAGCSGPAQQPTDPPTAPSPTTTSAVPTPTATATSSPTSEPIGTGDLPYDLMVRNSEDQVVTLDVVVTRNETGDIIFERSLTLDPSEGGRNFDLAFSEPGNYTITTTRDGETYRYGWTIEYIPPQFEVIVTARRGRVTYVASSA
ncbi:hypothetical protein BRD16_03385 [Halobacteriales archaeon SW_6_65_46]|nr:MAG: hypothetical protein BRD16_03385 [Halobacteriales archaeon SW_6_65_46]